MLKVVRAARPRLVPQGVAGAGTLQALSLHVPENQEQGSSRAGTRLAGGRLRASAVGARRGQGMACLMPCRTGCPGGVRRPRHGIQPRVRHPHPWRPSAPCHPRPHHQPVRGRALASAVRSSRIRELRAVGVTHRRGRDSPLEGARTLHSDLHGHQRYGDRVGGPASATSAGDAFAVWLRFLKVRVAVRRNRLGR